MAKEFCIVILLAIQLTTNAKDTFSNCSFTGPCFEECRFESSPCDSLPQIPIHSNSLNNSQILMYKTSRSGEKFRKYYLQWSTTDEIDNNTEIDLHMLPNTTYQKINGFGGALTDAVSYNLNKLNSTKLSNDILYAYFAWIDSAHNSGQGGAGYTYARVPMASCDFSLYSYTYSNQSDDFDLEHFSLSQTWDVKYRVQIIKNAEKLISQTSNETLHLYAVPWTGPPWMKDNHKFENGGKLNSNRTFWKTYALYFIKYLQSYNDFGISFDAVSVQNEPNLPAPWESMQWSTIEMTEFIAVYLGPMLREYNLSTNVWIHDGQKRDLPELVYAYFDEYYMREYNVSQYYIGLGIHWYFYPPPIKGCPSFECNGAFEEVKAMRHYLNNVQNRSDICMFGTEACEGGTNAIKSPPNRGVSLGDWYRGEQYAEDIIGDMNAGVNGWLDWNIILDSNGGPNHANNTCDAPIIIDFEKGKYYKQPMYYYMAHISRFIRPNSFRIGIESDGSNDLNEDVWYTAVVDYEMGLIVIVILNRNDNGKAYNITIKDERKGQIHLTVTPHSIQTIMYDNA